ncbi:MAG: glycogen debranching protein GlgX [Myxococcales bacterium]|nr:glycogen debranching protein GlgX [Myxococcales bacterium]
MYKVRPGTAYPLGANYDGSGTNFCIFSRVATKVELCLFESDGAESRVELRERHADCFHGYLLDVGPGKRYGYRVYGPNDPSSGHRCNPKKLLLDPYAYAVDGEIRWHPAVYDYPRDGYDRDTSNEDSAPYVPRSVVVDRSFDWRGDQRPNIPLHDTIIYETHVRGFTAQHPKIPQHLRGTYAGLAHPAAISHLKKLGITAVELLPIHQFFHREELIEKDRINYWGYDPLCYFAPHNAYASTSDPVKEFKQMVKDLHAAGLEIFIDVVYNHTCEGGHLGPTLCHRGIDSATYYRRQPEDPKHTEDFSGTGNTLDTRRLPIVQMILDSLRYWTQEMRVDGFRFDLASALVRESPGVSTRAAFLSAVHQDPALRTAKLIAEPWDIGGDGYLVGGFPSIWSEWNGKFRDDVRDFWRGAEHSLPDFARRISGSADLFESSLRLPQASINFVTAHDGFSLRDLVSYNNKHNLANGEDNRDGESHNRSWNCGIEGQTDDPEILELRQRQQRNFLATLFLSQGVPMLLGGDELSRTQRGNNNAYNQNNPISWLDWEKIDDRLLRFTSQLIHLRKQHPVFRRQRWFPTTTVADQLPDLEWFTPDGAKMTEADWHVGYAKSLGIFLNGTSNLGVDPEGQTIQDVNFYVVVNSWTGPLEFLLPEVLAHHHWESVLDTAQIGHEFHSQPVITDRPIPTVGHSVKVLRSLE